MQDGVDKADKSVKLVDIPGHPKLMRSAPQFYGEASAIIFLVDAVDFMAQKTGVAELLYEVLIRPDSHSATNKYDSFTLQK